MRLRVCVPAVVACALLAPPVVQAAPPAADPTKPGTHAVTRVDYDAGPTVLNVNPSNGAPVVADLRGELFIPSGRKPAPVVLLQHGRHATCSYGGFEFLGHPCPKTPVTSPVDSYRGYGYLASSLASHGYLVVSVDANGVNTFDLADLDAGALARAKLISRSLDLLGRWNAAPGPGSVGDRLRGRVDLNRLGLMGHSRGGEGVSYWLRYNERRTDGPRYRPSAVFALAPIDATRVVVPDVPWATLLPMCDGDVYNLQGAPVFERSKYAGERRTPLFQFTVMGTNHNWFNTTWGFDDGGTSDPVCSSRSSLGQRLTAAEQRRVGLTYMGAFLRRYVGGERAFDRLLQGRGGAAVACSREALVPCRSMVDVSYLPPSRTRETLVRPRLAGAQPAAEADAVLTTSGAAVVSGCDSSGRTAPCPQQGGRDPNRGWSLGPQLVLDWQGSGALTLTPRRALRASPQDELVLRAAADAGVNEEDQPQLAGTNAVRFQLVLVDGSGRRAAVRVGPSHGAPEPPPGLTRRNLVLGDVRVPLREFAGVALDDIRSISVVVGSGTGPGRLRLTDLSLQRF